ncbi:MAG: acetoin utilization deacetylase AcuC-like enzyme [Gammaproteobacteria bacterium]
MKAFFSHAHRAHSPGLWLFKGGIAEAQEVPQRADVLLQAAIDGGHDMIELEARDLAPSELRAVHAVHDGDYLDFLQTSWTRWSQLPGCSAQMIPNVNLGRHIRQRPQSIVGLAGYYQADGACPIGEGTWQGATASAQVAITAANELMSGRCTQAYALCRPPGHHAYADMAGGFCFLNNTAIAAQICADAGASKIAIVDVDVHHGNGTQEIFYQRADVFTASLHGDPANFYPHFVGYDAETGTGPGLGSNLNVPLAQGTMDNAYLPRLEAVLDRVARFTPDVLVVALGLDASGHDPLAFLDISSDGFERIGATLGALNLPTLLVQEGGYLSPHLGTNLQRTLRGFEATHNKSIPTPKGALRQ